MQLKDLVDKLYSNGTGVIPYIGCSKLSCRPCYKVLNKHEYITQGCHG